MTKRPPEMSQKNAKKRRDALNLLVKVPQPEALSPRAGGKGLKGRFAGRVLQPVSIQQMDDA